MFLRFFKKNVLNKLYYLGRLTHVENDNLFSPSHDVSEEADNACEASRIAEPGTNYNNDLATSTYALQVSLRNMKERYQRLQTKITDLENENDRLISGKSELFNEIGKMQESSIKLREKNLQLNHEVHSKHQECCSMKEQYSTLFKENLHLSTQLSQSSNEARNLNKEVEGLSKENALLKRDLEEIVEECHNFTGPLGECLSKVEKLAIRNLKKPYKPYFLKRKCQSDDENSGIFDELKQVSLVEVSHIDSWNFAFDESKDVESQSVETLLKATETMQRVAVLLNVHNQQLNDLKPHMLKHWKRNFDSTDIEDSEGGPCTNYLSRIPTYGSVLPPAVNLSVEEHLQSEPINDSGGETNVLVEEMGEEKGTHRVPFDWRKVEFQVSDEEEDVNMKGDPLRRELPTTRNVSTSPDLTLTFDFGEGCSGRVNSQDRRLTEEDRTCPMCNAVFPNILPQDTFESHVVSHFEVENGFEVIT